MSYFSHKPNIEIEINEWVAAKAFCGLDAVQQAKFFEHVAETTSHWNINRVMQWESLLQELWKKRDFDPYAGAKKMLAEWVEYFNSEIQDPGHFWQGEADRLGKLSATRQEAATILDENNQVLRERVTDLTNNHDKLTVDNIALAKNNVTLSKKLADVESSANSLANQVKDLGDEVRRLEEELETAQMELRSAEIRPV